MDQEKAVKKGIFWLQQQDYINIEDVRQFGEMMWGAGYDEGVQHRSYNKAISQYTVDGKFVKRYNSAVIAAKMVGGDKDNITKVARGKRRSSHGYVWKYE